MGEREDGGACSHSGPVQESRGERRDRGSWLAILALQKPRIKVATPQVSISSTTSINRGSHIFVAVEY